MQPFSPISALRITLASPEQIHSWSSGEVKKAETINYRTLKPERDGLFCERIFGPTKDWTCACNKYRRPRFKGRICEKCGVTITRARVRRERMGHIELAAPVSHVWYAHGMPSRLGLLLDLSPRELDNVLSYTRYIVLHVDEEARIQEIQRIKDEIAGLEAFLHEEYDTTKDVQQISRQEAASILIGTQQVDSQERLEESFTQVVGKSSLSHNTNTDQLQVPEHIEQLDWLNISPAGSYASEEQSEISEISSAIDINEVNGTSDTDDISDIDDTLELLYSRPSINDRIRQLQQVRHDLAELTPLTLLEIDHYRLLRDECEQVFRANIGAEAIQELLGDLDLEQMARSLRREIHDREGALRTRAIKRLKIVESFLRSQVDPQWMILTAIPVLPPDLRPVLQLTGGRFATSDINELYSRVIHRNNRLKHFMANGAPDLIIHHEKSALQAACDSLFDNMHCRKPLVGANRKPLKSLSDSLRGKQGRFRHNMLGKRVDYSGRSVISVGLDLKLHQCGLPKKIALELFKPFVIHKLLAYNVVETARQGKRAVERHDPAIWDILDEVMRGRLVMLNRAPSLHRLSIQAFEPILVEGSAIRLHPQVCSAFNADFDGDQMAVHLPLSTEAQEEARNLMLSTRNLLSAASGEPSISVSQEQVLGCFYLTQERPGKKGEGRVFADADEAMMAYAHGVIDLQARISVRMEQETIFEQPLPTPPIAHMKGRQLTTTVGRLLFNEVLPKRLQFKNYAMKKEYLKQIIWDCIKIYGEARTAILADAIKRLGFKHATKAGLSFSIKDVTVPPGKKEVLADADGKIGELSDEWRSGLITRDELYKQSIEVWQDATAEIEKQVQQVLDPFGSIATIANSGATKAKLQQIRQLSGMRGLMASPSGTVIETPVRGNFLEGLSMAEYFISSHGARKSLMDRSLNTAEAGYLTSRFVNVAQDVIVTEEDCGTTEGLFINDKENKQMGLADSRSRLIGRVLAEPLPQVELLAGEPLNEEAIERIIAAQITIVRVRSVLACQARRGVCRLCYGWDLSKRALVQLGMAVGIIAAQSIGEPGTQLTMRTFHSGGIAGGQGDITQGLPRVEELFEGRIPKDGAIISESDGVIKITKKGGMGGHTINVVSNTILLDEYPLPQGCLILLNGTQDRKHVQQGDIIAALQVKAGETKVTNQEHLVLARLTGELFISESGILTIRAEHSTTHTYEIPPGRTLVVEEGQQIQAGEPLTAGALNPQNILRYSGREELERYFLREAQRVYRTTGAYIHDKHFEIIIRQMLRYVQIEDSGDTDLLPEDLVDSFEYEDINVRTLAEGGEPATAHVVLLGLTRATLATKSWLAAASFQQTNRVLTEAAIEGSTDHLVGLKENVILGKLIPAGTGILPRKTPPPQKLPARRGRKPKSSV